MNTQRTLVSLVTKYPRPGTAKTRLGKVAGDEVASDIALALIVDLFASLQGAFPNLTIETDSEQSAHLFVRLFGSIEVAVESAGTALQRVERVFRRYCDTYAKVVAVFSDIPYLTPGVIKAAEKSLDTCDIVLGPDDGGGCYLVGMKDYAAVFDVPERGPYFPALLANANTLSKTVSILETLFDIDIYSDLEKISTDKIHVLCPGFWEALKRNRLLPT